jgi:hypothetical protein
VRGIFFSEDEARTVERLLAGDGYDVALSRVRYAGEDDDEDHPWAVSTDPPALLHEQHVDRYEGWLDDDDDAKPSPAPLELPATPKRLHAPPEDPGR